MKVSYLLITACLLVACTGDRLVLSPEQVVARSIPRDAQQFQLLAQGVTPEREIAVVYSYRIPTPAEPWPEDYTLGYKIFKRVGWGRWEDTWTSEGSTPTMIQVPFPIQYNVFQNGYTAVYGPLQSPRIQSVEAVFSNGEAVRQDFEGTGFLIFWEEKVDVCELRFYDSQGGLLESKVLSERHEGSNECP
jgi:hypothetical protein